MRITAQRRRVFGIRPAQLRTTLNSQYRPWKIRLCGDPWYASIISGNDGPIFGGAVHPPRLKAHFAAEVVDASKIARRPARGCRRVRARLLTCSGEQVVLIITRTG
jgi:hypothetical protein